MKFKNSPSGKMVKAINGSYSFFMPNPLPPVLQWDINLVNDLSTADFILGQLAREGSRLPNPQLLMRPFMAREAVLSSKIEGTHTTLGEILANQAGIASAGDAHDLQEVQNYIEALEYGLQRMEDLPLSLRLIKEIHAKLMQGVRGAHATPGEFRRSQNWIGTPGCTLMTAKYVPPSPEELMNCLGSFESFLYDTSLPSLVHIALCHYQFEAIHPFLDGNGRVGRLLITLLLVKRNKILPSPLLYLSAFFEATRDEYYYQLGQVSSTGSWNQWLSYFLNGVALQSSDVLSRTERINGLIDQWKIEMTSKSESLVSRVINQFAINPYCTITHICENLDAAFTTVQRVIDKLEEAKIVSQTSDAKRDRVYCASKILDILEEPAKVKRFYTENI